MPTSSAIGPHTAEFLLSPGGRAAAAELTAADPATLADEWLAARLGQLRRRFTPEQAGALVTLARLRQRAAPKFPHAAQLFFTAEALEQATAWEVAATHAERLDRYAPPGPLLDLGCGIGGDLLQLAQRRPVIAYELDPVRALFAQANAEVMGLAGQVEVRGRDWVADMQRGLLPPAAGAFTDPARRNEERRTFRLAQMQPPISALLALQGAIPALGVKVMPGVADVELPAECGVEFISHHGVCKEAVLWFGPARGRRKWAALLPKVQEGAAGCVLALPGDDDDDLPPLGPLAAGQVLYEPDCALIRAGCLAEVCRRLGAHLFDPQIAYLVGEQREHTPLAQAFWVEEVHPFSLKLLNGRLQALGVARVELKKRGFPQEPESLRPRLKLQRQGRDAVVIFTRRGDERLMLLGRRAEK
jgi:SAM-dependent methyltransferase